MSGVDNRISDRRVYRVVGNHRKTTIFVLTIAYGSKIFYSLMNIALYIIIYNTEQDDKFSIGIRPCFNSKKKIEQ